MSPFLALLADNREHATKDIINARSLHFSLMDEQRNEMFDSGNQRVIDNHVGWARTYMKKAGLIHSPRRGILAITQLGHDALASGQTINNAYLKPFESFLEFQNLSSTKNDLPVSPQKSEQSTEQEQEQTPTELIEQAHNMLNKDLADDLLDTIRNGDPSFLSVWW